MPINRLLKNETVPPEELRRLKVAYEAALTALFLVDRNDPITELVARKVIDVGQRSPSLSPFLIAAAALKELGAKQHPDGSSTLLS